VAFALEISNILELLFRDYGGKHSSVKIYVDSGVVDPSSGVADEISSRAQALSNSALYETNILIAAEDDDPGDPTDGPYARPADKAQLVFSTADGPPVILQIGAPDESIFLDSWTVNPGNADVIALVDAMKENAVTQEGGAITALRKGNRRRPPRRKGQ